MLKESGNETFDLPATTAFAAYLSNSERFYPLLIGIFRALLFDRFSLHIIEYRFDQNMFNLDMGWLSKSRLVNLTLVSNRTCLKECFFINLFLIQHIFKRFAKEASPSLIQGKACFVHQIQYFHNNNTGGYYLQPW